MKKLLSKARATFNDSLVFPTTNPPYPVPAQPAQNYPAQQPHPPGPPGPQPPTPTDVFRYRYAHGANLGSVFVLEKWLHSSLFPDPDTPSSELSAVTASIKATSISQTRSTWEAHWSNALTPQDWSWLRDTARCTALRLPIGYFTLGPAFTHGTPFQPVADVYANAWQHVRDLCTTARSYGIAVLIDLHALPGGANSDLHSGCATGKVEFWSSRQNRALATRCVEFITHEVASRRLGDAIVGLQLVNEACWGAGDMGMWAWYDEVLHAVGGIDASLPIYVSDAWELDKTVQWAKESNARRGGGSNQVLIDTHRYFTFSDEHRSMTPQAIIDLVASGAGNPSPGVSIVVGEYSCVLDGQTWSRARDDEKPSYVQRFAEAQTRSHRAHTAGAYFWTLKMEWMPGGEWGFMEQVDNGNITAPAHMTLSSDEVRTRIEAASNQRAEMAQREKHSHAKWWGEAGRGGGGGDESMEHWRFDAGWQLGWEDAVSFFGMRRSGGLGGGGGSGGDRIGGVDAWAERRAWQTGLAVGKWAWEWHHGFRAGVAAAEGALGLR